VPSVVGLELSAAQTKLTAEGIKFTLGEKDYFDNVKAGQVGKVEPGSGTKIKPGQTVKIIESKGRLPRTVPPVKGLTQDDARTTLQNAGFTNVAAAVKYQASGDIENDKVVGTDPKENDKVSPDEPITVIVSKGIVMPDVVNMTKDEAWAALSKLGLTIRVDENTRDGSKPTGTVLRQDPAKDIQVKAGDRVDIFINKPDCLIDVFNLFCDGDNSTDDQGNKRIPRLAGKSVDEAVQILQQRGFQVNVQHQFNSGKVFRVQPNGGEKAPAGSVVTIWD
jgi:serine/threonine-protein kinase